MIAFLGDAQAHYDASGSVTHAYSHLSLGTPVARVDRTGPSSTTVEYQFHGLGDNTLAAVDWAGTINASFSYTPFGEIVQATDGGGAQAGLTVHKQHLNDKFEDDGSQLSYYGARYYDKYAMSWTQSDPVFQRAPDAAALSTPRRANLHSFSLNNPLRYVDPDGRNPTSSTSLYVHAPIESYPIEVPEDQRTLDQRRLQALNADADWQMKPGMGGVVAAFRSFFGRIALMPRMTAWIHQVFNDTVSATDLRIYRGEVASYHTLVDDVDPDAVREVVDRARTIRSMLGWGFFLYWLRDGGMQPAATPPSNPDGPPDVLVRPGGPGGGSRGQADTPFSKSIQNLRSGDTKWKLQSAHAEPAIGRAYKGAMSLEEVYKHATTGEAIVRHRIFRGSELLHETFRPYAKMR